MTQDRFPYALLEGTNMLEVVQKMAQGTPIKARLRFGSKGPLVTKLQEALKGRGFYEGAIDEDFGNRTLRGVLAFQQAAFGHDQDNGIVGPVTAQGLGIGDDWPSL